MSNRMSERIAYYRCSTSDQSIEAQRHALGGEFDKEFSDEGISGAVLAANRPGFTELLKYAREGDTVCVFAVDRLGRDAIDIQATVRDLISKGVKVEIHGIGTVAKGVGEVIVAVLAQVAAMERQKIIERTAAGRDKAKEALAATGKTHRGKASLGRPVGATKATKLDGTPHLDPKAVVKWRKANKKSIAETAKFWQISTATVKRYCSEYQYLV